MNLGLDRHPPMRRVLFVAIAVAALATLVALPWAGLRAIEDANQGTHDLTEVLATANAANGSVGRAAAAPARNYELSGRPEDYLVFRGAMDDANYSLSELERVIPASERLEIVVELRDYLDSARLFLAELMRREDFFRAGLTANAPPNAGAYFSAHNALLRNERIFGDSAVDLGGDLDSSRNSAMSEARELLFGAVAVAILGVAVIAVLEGRRIRRQMSATEERLAAAEQAAEQRATMVNLASHELRNPLAVMSLAAQMLQSSAADSGDPLLSQVADDAYAAARRSEALVAELLDLSRLDANRLKLAIRPTRLAPVLDEAVLLTVHHLGERPVAVDGVLDAAVLADGSRLAIILRNLVDNAFKYSPRGSEVTIRIVAGESRISVEVRDLGPGIPAADRERVFHRFERLTATQHIGGIGIGLHLSRELARRMGGDLSVAESDGGACLRLVLPQAIAVLEAA